MATGNDSILRDTPGCCVRSFVQKKDQKGEDFSTLREICSWEGVSFSFFAVYDGHGGSQVAEYCKKQMHFHLMLQMNRLAKYVVGNGSSCALAAWCEHLPAALVLAFEAVDLHCNTNLGVSGATATVVVVTGIPTQGDAGMLVTVANVGDSHAMLDTGDEVFMLSEDHRCDNNKSEQQRVKQSGGNVAHHITDADKIRVTKDELMQFYKNHVKGETSETFIDAVLAEYAGRDQKLRKELRKKYGDEPGHSGKGPLRIWPGGLMMTRTLGDKDALHSIATPAVFHTLLPSSGGRVIIASDGKRPSPPLQQQYRLLSVAENCLLLFLFVRRVVGRVLAQGRSPYRAQAESSACSIGACIEGSEEGGQVQR
jgi:serine/threonine protein phosphatase PrpC